MAVGGCGCGCGCKVGGWGFIRGPGGQGGEGGKRLPGCIKANMRAISSRLLNIYTPCIWNSASLYIQPAEPGY